MSKRFLTIIGCALVFTTAIGFGVTAARLTSKPSSSPRHISASKDFRYETVEQLCQNADAAFSGKIIAAEDAGDAFDSKRFTIDVTQDWFGGLKGSVIVDSNNEDYEIGREYVFFVNQLDLVYFDAPRLIDLDFETTIEVKDQTVFFPEIFKNKSISVKEFSDMILTKDAVLPPSKIVDQLSVDKLAQEADFIIIAIPRNVESFTSYSSVANLEKIEILKGEQYFNEEIQYILPKDAIEGHEYLFSMSCQEDGVLFLTARNGCMLESYDHEYKTLIENLSVLG